MGIGELIAIILGSNALITGIVQIVLWILNRKAKKKDDATGANKHVKNALRVLLYDRIKYLAKHHIGVGYISVEDLEDLTKMHDSYRDDLDGNGFLDGLMAQVKALPLRK